jgi:chromate transporter
LSDAAAPDPRPPRSALELLSLAQVLPGPNIVNLSLMFGHRHFGLRGAAAALLGLTAVPTLIVLVLVGV